MNQSPAGRESPGAPNPCRLDLARLRHELGIACSSPDAFAASLPFAPDDATAGIENEWQTVTIGTADSADLPRAICESRYYRNLARRAAAGETPARRRADLDAWIADNRDGAWEHSWVTFPLRRLSPAARAALDRDLLADKAHPDGPRRGDVARFLVARAGEDCLRIPVSYLLNLALVDATGRGDDAALAATGRRYAAHFLSDNTSPETLSFYPARLTRAGGMGRAVAEETLRRYLLTTLLTEHANRSFGLADDGQRVLVYFAPHTPERLKRLNDLVPDQFYRDLFMSPCLSGWNRGEAKHAYMHLCHQVLSRSRINAMAKLREAGLVPRNLVVLPNMSNTSLANNGTHITLGSRRLGAWRVAQPDDTAEKGLADLTIKIVEHFLPLSVGTYSAAPYRLGFDAFHPETALGFLPHELDFTHLRMLWRRWVKKADLRVMGRPLTPFGPAALDRSLAFLLGLRGDWVCDFRLLDYLVAPLSTPESPALDGRPGNQARLLQDLAQQGVFDGGMSFYTLYRQREYARMGFCGYEGRHYSLFPDLARDLAPACDLQTLITALAQHYLFEGRYTHADLPDDPMSESERRQTFFAAAMGVPTIYVRRESRNRLLLDIVARARGVRRSRRYPAYLRVPVPAYRLALLDALRADAPALVEALGAGALLDDLRARLEAPAGHAAAERLTRDILESDADPLRTPAPVFNRAADRFYRDTLRRRHIADALRLLQSDGTLDAADLDAARRDLADGRLPDEQLARLIRGVLDAIARAGGRATAATPAAGAAA